MGGFRNIMIYSYAMNDTNERNLGPQPLDRIMTKLELDAHDLVAASTQQITHKMVTRARKGRKLSRRVQFKIVNALNNIAENEYSLRDLFNY